MTPDADRDDGDDDTDRDADVDDAHVPDHVRGVCDIGGCDELANRAYSDGETYLEVCEAHGDRIADQFDSDYDRVAHGSPHRESGPRRRIDHDCGGEILVFDAPEDGEYRVCTGCGYAMRLQPGEDGAVDVRYTDAVER